MKKKKHKKAISRKPEGFEQPYLEASFATPERTLTARHNRVEKLKFGYFILYRMFFKKNIKNHEKRHILKTKRI